MGYVATQPICWSVLIVSPTVWHWGPPRRQALCTHPAHLWATSDFVPLFGHSPDGKGYVATSPTCGPLLGPMLILLPALKLWGPRTRKG